MQDIKIYDAEDNGGVEGLTDIQFDAAGNPILVEGEERTHQVLKSFIVMSKGDFPLDPDRGSELEQLIGSVTNEEDKVKGDIERTVSDALDYFLEIQRVESQGDRIDDSEFVTNFRDIEVSTRVSDPRWIDIYVYPVFLEAAINNANAQGEALIFTHKAF